MHVRINHEIDGFNVRVLFLILRISHPGRGCGDQFHREWRLAQSAKLPEARVGRPAAAAAERLGCGIPRRRKMVNITMLQMRNGLSKDILFTMWFHFQPLSSQTLITSYRTLERRALLPWRLASQACLGCPQEVDPQYALSDPQAEGAGAKVANCPGSECRTRRHSPTRGQCGLQSERSKRVRLPVLLARVLATDLSAEEAPTVVSFVPARQTECHRRVARCVGSVQLRSGEGWCPPLCRERSGREMENGAWTSEPPKSRMRTASCGSRQVTAVRCRGMSAVGSRGMCAMGSKECAMGSTAELELQLHCNALLGVS